MKWGEAIEIIKNIGFEALLAALLSVANVLLNAVLDLLRGRVEPMSKPDVQYEPDW